MSFYRCPAFRRAVRQIARVAGLIACLAVAVSSTETSAQSPAPYPQASGSRAQTITPADLNSVLDLDGPWRFHTGDDPHFADPALDDSSWPSIRAHQPLQSVGIRSMPGGYLWARIHLRVPTAAGPLAIALYPNYFEQYEVFVNGSPVASTPGMATRTVRIGSAFPIALPRSEDMVLAIRFYFTDFKNMGIAFPRVSLGTSGGMQAATKLAHFQLLLDNGFLAHYAGLCIYLLVGITAVILHRAQRDHGEYLWLGIATLMFALYSVVEIVVFSGWVSYGSVPVVALHYSTWIFNAAHIEFVVRFTRTRRRWPIWGVQGAMLIAPLFYLSSSNLDSLRFTMVIGSGLFLVAEIACFVSAYRRKVPESGLLLIPAIAWVLLNLAWGASIAYPAVAYWGGVFRFGPVGIQGNHLGYMLFCLGIVAVVLRRFIRVARDEEHAAAELEAARTVQQILVPEEVPIIPGFSIQAVYQPAGQVGGDFYQLLPSPNGGLLAIIGDVSGKGMPAAMTVSLLVGTVRTLAHYTQDPAGILTAMNQRLIGRGSGFTTALVLRLDPDGTLTAANAGHISPYANGKELDIENGLPLGLTAAAAYSNSTLHLEANTALTLLTDGVVEAQNAKGELFGFDRAAEISSKSAQNVASAAKTFGQQDDITVLSLALVMGA